jgi:hypothetical protein
MNRGIIYLHSVISECLTGLSKLCLLCCAHNLPLGPSVSSAESGTLPLCSQNTLCTVLTLYLEFYVIVSPVFVFSSVNVCWMKSQILYVSCHGDPPFKSHPNSYNYYVSIKFNKNKMLKAIPMTFARFLSPCVKFSQRMERELLLNKLFYWFQLKLETVSLCFSNSSYRPVAPKERPDYQGVH